MSCELFLFPLHLSLYAHVWFDYIREEGEREPVILNASRERVVGCSWRCIQDRLHYYSLRLVTRHVTAMWHTRALAHRDTHPPSPIQPFPLVRLFNYSTRRRRQYSSKEMDCATSAPFIYHFINNRIERESLLLHPTNCISSRKWWNVVDSSFFFNWNWKKKYFFSGARVDEMSRLPSVNGIPCRLKWKIWKACFHYRNLSPAMQSTTGSFFERPDCPFPSLKFINDSFWHISPAARFLSWSSLTGQHLVWWCFITCSPSFALVFYGPLSLSAILSHTKIRNISFFFSLCKLNTMRGSSIGDFLLSKRGSISCAPS